MADTTDCKPETEPHPYMFGEYVDPVSRDYVVIDGTFDLATLKRLVEYLETLPE